MVPHFEVLHGKLEEEGAEQHQHAVEEVVDNPAEVGNNLVAASDALGLELDQDQMGTFAQGEEGLQLVEAVVVHL